MNEEQAEVKDKPTIEEVLKDSKDVLGNAHHEAVMSACLCQFLTDTFMGMAETYDSDIANSADYWSGLSLTVEGLRDKFEHIGQGIEKTQLALFSAGERLADTGFLRGKLGEVEGTEAQAVEGEKLSASLQGMIQVIGEGFDMGAFLGDLQAGKCEEVSSYWGNGGEEA